MERRLEFIEFRLYWEGGVNCSDIVEAFDVSVPQASKDLTLYQERAPQNAVYDKSAKRYIASNEFQPCFLKPDAGQYLNQLRSVAEGILASSNLGLLILLPMLDRLYRPAASTTIRCERCLRRSAKAKQSRSNINRSLAMIHAGDGSRRMQSALTGFGGTPAPIARLASRSRPFCSRGS